MCTICRSTYIHVSYSGHFVLSSPLQVRNPLITVFALHFISREIKGLRTVKQEANLFANENNSNVLQIVFLVVFARPLQVCNELVTAIALHFSSCGIHIL